MAKLLHKNLNNSHTYIAQSQLFNENIKKNNKILNQWKIRNQVGFNIFAPSPFVFLEFRWQKQTLNIFSIFLLFCFLVLKVENTISWRESIIKSFEIKHNSPASNIQVIAQCLANLSKSLSWSYLSINILPCGK